MKFAPFNGAYAGHKEAMGRAGLIPEWNLWFGIYDFNDEGRTGKNWEIMKMEEEVRKSKMRGDDTRRHFLLTLVASA